jgi:hypothetical protein
MIVEHHPDVVLKTIQRNEATYEWFINEWVHLVVVDPETREFRQFANGDFVAYKPVTSQVQTVADLTPVLESAHDNLPVLVLS